ncbi:Uncharacterised protein [Corynebacterium kutscheri]|uniref:Secreted protein n=1 Tax=Corynebacterium kutscheri TaxID=35755 RepID=A0A0F6TEK9_9CORY|nr:hypothetical protein [Corynebacterium kutscheri]AKE42259.1 hypothetical protein UL82_10625 [Corynebacterium kutscheri]VEH05659.1 Uncharacterised protein [Corynebacterium kutscheri]VEH10603.1 Uncharacterised protein [Corynebacterium kutscheri]VEH81554.1 Uncharacterised protein [Corynebacterium kutscheri]
MNSIKKFGVSLIAATVILGATAAPAMAETTDNGAASLSSASSELNPTEINEFLKIFNTMFKTMNDALNFANQLQKLLGK